MLGGSSSGGRRRGGSGGLSGGCFLVGDRGAVVEVGVDEALAPPDVVHASDQLAFPQGAVGQGEAGGLL